MILRIERNNIPSSITESTSTLSIQTSDWDNPSAFYPSGWECNIANSFSEQIMVITITLCGTWCTRATFQAMIKLWYHLNFWSAHMAGNPDIYNPQCGSVAEFGKCVPRVFKLNDYCLVTFDLYSDTASDVDSTMTMSWATAATTTTHTSSSSIFVHMLSREALLPAVRPHLQGLLLPLQAPPHRTQMGHLPLTLEVATQKCMLEPFWLLHAVSLLFLH